jgi:hypothetical protein
VPSVELERPHGVDADALEFRVIVGVLQLMVRIPGADDEELIVTVPVKSKLLVTESVTETPVAPTLKLVAPRGAIVNPPTWTNAEPKWVAVPGEAVPVIFSEYDPTWVEFRPHEAVLVELADRLVGEPGQFTVKPLTGLEVSVTVPTKSKVLFIETVITAPGAPLLKFVRGRTAKANPPTWTIVDARWLAVPGEPELVTVTT